MKLTQKTKYFVYGSLVTALSVPLAIKAADTITTVFQEGDVISATVINDIFSRINMVQRGFSSNDEITGTWMCKTYSSFSQELDRCEKSGSNRLFKSGLIQFDPVNNSVFMQNVWPYNDCSARNITRNYDVIAGNVFAGSDLFEVKMRSPSEIVLSSGNTIVHCNKSDVAPVAPNNLTASSLNKNVTLSWINQGTNQISLKIQRKLVENLSVEGAIQSQSFVTVAEIDGTLTSYTDTVTQAATYQYRVISANAYGDSMSSSVIETIVSE